MEETGGFAKTVFYYLRICYSNSCYVKVTGKAINQGDD